jgi:hypothetical protein
MVNTIGAKERGRENRRQTDKQTNETKENPFTL